MIGLGTLIDGGFILVGGLAGLAFGRFLTPRIQDTLLKATAVAILFVGLSGALAGMLSLEGGKLAAVNSALVVGSLALGSLIGEVFDLERQLDRFGEWLKYATRSNGDSAFVDAFVSASLSVEWAPWQSWAPFRTASRETGPHWRSKVPSMRCSCAP